MVKNKNDESEVRYCPLLDKLCILEDCGWYYAKLDTCAVQLIPYNLYKHSDNLEKCSSSLDSILNYILERR